MSVTMVLDLSKINTPETYTALFNAKNRGGIESPEIILNESAKYSC